MLKSILKIVLCVWYCCFNIQLHAQKDSIVLSNNYVKRVFAFNKSQDGFVSTAFINVPVAQNYIKDANPEFAISLNDLEVTGLNCRYLNHSLVTVK
ncbi:MAG: hypothetical protein ACRCVT_09965, partial [Leadbetterella sp.]